MAFLCRTIGLKELELALQSYFSDMNIRVEDIEHSVGDRFNTNAVAYRALFLVSGDVKPEPENPRLTCKDLKRMEKEIIETFRLPSLVMSPPHQHKPRKSKPKKLGRDDLTESEHKAGVDVYTYPNGDRFAVRKGAVPPLVAMSGGPRRSDVERLEMEEY